MKWTIVNIFLILTLGLNGTGQIQTNGTVIVITSFQSEIVFAADSRIASDSSYSDDDCKISVFGNRVIFAASGRGGVRNVITHTYIWNAHTLAKNEFRHLTRNSTPQLLAEKLASAWGLAIKKELEEDIARNKEYALLHVEDDQVLALGAFAAFEKDGTFLIAVERITYEINSNGAVVVKASMAQRVTSPGGPIYLGKGEIIRECFAGQTPRSREWKRDMQMGIDFSADPTVFTAKKLVQLTIENYPRTRADGKGGQFSIVGGPIAITRLTQKGVDWVDKACCARK